MKINYFFIAVSAVLLTAACQKEQPQNEDPLNPTEPEKELVPMTFTASCEEVVPSNDSTKVYFDLSTYSQKWNKGDEVALFAGETASKEKLTNNGTDGDSHAVFTGNVTKADTYYALYPYSAATSISDGVITGTFPQTQTLSNNGTDPSCLISVATTTGTNLQFYNAFGLIQFTFEADTQITEIIIEGNDGEILAGTFTVNPTGKKCIMGDSGETNIILKYNSDGASFPKGTYAAAVPPVKFSNGFKVIFRKETGICSIKNIKSEIEIGRGKARTYSSTSSFQPGTYKYYYILTKDDLDQWATNETNWTSDDVVYLGADIDCNKEEWKDVRGTKTFSGTFDGRNHRIYNLHVTGEDKKAGFFYATSGTVKNVCFGSKDYDFSEKSGTADGSSYIKIANCGVTDWYYAGPIAYANGGTIQNVTNYIPVSFQNGNSTTTPYPRIGGIAGTMKENTTIKDCTNYGSVTCDTENSVDGNVKYEIGGIVSRNDGTGCTISGCKNYGTVTNNCKSVLSVGGIIGSVANDMTTFSGCENYGNVTNTYTASAGTMNIGGIVGYIPSDTEVQITTMKNYGAVSNAAAVNSLCMGGISGYTSDTDYEGCTNTGTVVNTAETSGQIMVGGIMGRGVGEFSVTDCINGQSEKSTGAVSNSGPSGTSTISVGGIAGSVCGDSDNTLYATLKSCKNYGSVTNSGVSTEDQPGTRIGGLVGWSDQCVKLNSSENINYGTVTESSSSTYPAVGGITGYVNNANTTLAGCKNQGSVVASGAIVTEYVVGGVVGYVNVKATLSSQTYNTTNSGNITVSNSNSTNLIVGGVLGHTNTTADVSYAKNSGNITIENVTATYIIVGGVVGSRNATATQNYTGLENSGNITGSGLTVSTYAWVGGIHSGAYTGDRAGITYSDCSNSGSINMGIRRTGYTIVDNNIKMLRIGGIAGYANKVASSGSLTCTGDISYYNSSSSQSRATIGGIFGYINISKLKNCKYDGTLWTNYTKQAAYAGGIVGNYKTADYTLENCMVGGRVYGSGSGDYMAGLFVSSAQSTYKVTFTGCKVKRGAVANTTTINSESDLTVNLLTGASHSTGTTDGVSVVDSF